jgi:hypothetical protein
MTSYILTREHNEYDQYGAYFVCFFHIKPSVEDLVKAFDKFEGSPCTPERAKRLLDTNGGRQGSEDVWWSLRHVASSARDSTP